MFAPCTFTTDSTVAFKVTLDGISQVDTPLVSALHSQFYSTLHVEEHPSPLSVFPSSHGAFNLMPSPHIYSQRLVEGMRVYPGIKLHLMHECVGVVIS